MFNTSAADAKASLSNVSFVSFQLSARALNVSDTHAADAKASAFNVSSAFSFSDLVRV